MPSRGQKFIEQFLKPNLNSKRFGTRLLWLNKEFQIFQVQWNHKSASGWTKDDAEVFMEWDKIKGRYIPDDKDRFTKSKQRFRAIMYKLMKAGHITELTYYCNDKFTKIYCFGSKENISSEIIVESIISRGYEFGEIEESSDEWMYNGVSEALIDRSQISGKTNVLFNNIEDHKYANTNTISYLYVDIIPENSTEKQVTFSGIDNSYMQGSNDCSENHSNYNVKLEDIGNITYEPRSEECLFSPEHLLYI